MPRVPCADVIYLEARAVIIVWRTSSTSVMFKVDEYLEQAKRARAQAANAPDDFKRNFERIAEGWDRLAAERLEFLRQRVQDGTLTWTDSDTEGAGVSVGKKPMRLAS